NMKDVLKWLANVAAIVIVFPAFATYTLGRIVIGEKKAFPGWAQALSLIPGIFGAYIRRAFYSLVFRNCGSGTWIGFGSIFSHPSCTLGRDVYVGCYCCLGEVTLEDDVLIGSHVSIINGSAQHGTDRLDIPVREQQGVWPHITIGQDTWIGDRAVVMANVGTH